MNISAIDPVDKEIPLPSFSFVFLHSHFYLPENECF